MDVLRAGTDSGKDAMIREWMKAVWASWEDRQVGVREMAGESLERARK